jgi:hypothetical protein
LRTASIGVEPPLDPLLEPFELGDFDLGFDFDFEPDDFGFADFGFALFEDRGFAAFDCDFAAFGFEALAFGFDLDFACDLGFGCAFGFACEFDLLDEPALFDADGFFDFVSAIFLSPRGVFPNRSGTQSIGGKSR